MLCQLAMIECHICKELCCILASYD